MVDRPVYNLIANALLALSYSKKTNNTIWIGVWEERLEILVKENMPHGSGFDSDTLLDYDKSSDEKLVFTTSFHHMSLGYYDGWTEHTITVKPNLALGYTITVSGQNRNDIKDYIAENFRDSLDRLTDFASMSTFA